MAPASAAPRERQSGFWVANLRHVAPTAPRRQTRCDMCGATLDETHPQLISLSDHTLLCACATCALLCEIGETHGFRRVSRKVLRLTEFTLPSGEWRALQIPVALAFFQYRSLESRVVAMYPGPAGAVECALRAAAWDGVLRANSALATLVPDVEALLVNRIEEPHQYFLVSIDRCYELVGTIRRQWRGLSGGVETAAAIRTFFAHLNDAAGSVVPQ